MTKITYSGTLLNHGDEVWIHIPGLADDVGEWGVVDEDGDTTDPRVAVRFMGAQYPTPIMRETIKFVRTS